MPESLGSEPQKETMKITDTMRLNWMEKLESRRIFWLTNPVGKTIVGVSNCEARDWSEFKRSTFRAAIDAAIRAGRK